MERMKGTMKKTISLLMILICFSSLCVAYADEINLSGMNYDELVALKDRINLAIWNSETWEEVVVPQGVWEVGTDIPAGKWEIKALPEAETRIIYGDELKDGGTNVVMKSFQRIKDSGYHYFDAASDVTSWIIDVEEGNYVHIDEGPAVFMPYNGKPSLGFKSELKSAESESTSTNSYSTATEAEQSKQSNSSSSSNSSALDEALYIANSLDRIRQDAFDYIDSWGS